jgi:diguanylate cyclase (GGDEF)-like protein/PAS domain S-box-containing protein
MPEEGTHTLKKSGGERSALVVWCSSNGTIERIEHDSCALVTEGCGSNLADLVDPSSRDKALLFLTQLQDESVLLDWECTVQLDGTLQVLKLSGIKAEGSLLVLGDPQAITLQHILMEAGSLYSLGGALLKAVVETYGCSTASIESKSNRMYNEIIQLSNQQAALHRELAKKTVTLEARTAELKELNQVLTTITDGIQDSIMLLAPDSRILWANRAAQLGRRGKDLVGSSCHDFVNSPDSGCAASDARCPLAAALLSGRPEHGTHIHYDLEGTPWYAEVTVYPVLNDERKITQLVRISKDITQRKQMEEQLQQEALTDELTGIPNRRGFERHFAAEWRRGLRNKSMLTITMIDIDFFKNYNDLYGHQQGDECLRQVAQCIKAALRRPGDHASRYGGEEFVVLLPETDAENAETVTDAIRANLLERAIPHLDSKAAPYVTVSIGIADAIPSLDQNPLTLLQSADKALYAAKRLGRNRVHRMILKG